MTKSWLKHIHLFLAIGFGVFLLACAESKDAQSEDPVLTAYQLIDEQRAEEAIVYLEKKLEEKPNDHDLRMTLASAYAHHGGVKIQKFVPLIKQIMQMQDLLKEKEEETAKKKAAEEKAEPETKKDAVEIEVGDGDKVTYTTEDIAFGLNQAGIFVGLYSAIPDVTEENLVYVTHAISIINSLGSNITDADKTFRVVLNIIRLKTFISKHLVSELMNVLENSGQDIKKCSVNPDVARREGLRGLNILRSVVKDVADIRPEMKEKLEELLVRSDEAAANLTLAIQSGTVMSNQEQQAVTDTVIQNGFGKILKCDGEPAAQ